ncbi:gamma-glutamylcyclotransferase family protein [Pelotalea chapellei]|uniref:Gamma-glutamylcyclotransferase family protein n=1 Tax=Pelotalea chapellei TaxID=44671 RepID=A0ABS5U6G1_9BACT|nr:gamma-glutamylcyclotransferase family protein [Pelotalea chapellei]MBT1071257.1 gamma-glutamylcyclotransferase [Pelotalea chapellei]
MEGNNLIFVYGSLRQNHVNHHLLVDARYYGLCTTREKYAMYVVSGYPYVTSSENRYPIVGELYGIDEETLHTLDKMEGHPRYYVRRETTVIQGNTEYTAWMYFRDPYGTLMTSGDINDGCSPGSQNRKAQEG